MNNHQLSLEAEKSLQQIKELDQIDKKIAFYAERGSDWNHYSNIINELINIHNIEVYYITSDHTDPILTNNNKSPMIETVSYYFNMHAGIEESVAATKSFVLTILNLIKLVSVVSDNQQILSKINDLPTIIERENQNVWNPNIVENHQKMMIFKLNKNVLSIHFKAIVNCL